MAEGNMTPEQRPDDRISKLENPDEISENEVLSHDSSEAIDQIPEDGEIAQSGLPITDLTRRSGFIQIPRLPQRGEVKERRNQEAEDKFMLDIVLLERMKALSEKISSSPLSEERLAEFYDPEKVLTAYSNSDDHHKKNIRTNIRTHLEKRKQTVFGILTADLRKIYTDQGLSKEEVDEKTEGLTTGIVGKKRRHLNQLPKEAQIRILENMAEERNKTLISNFDEYMHALSFSNPYPFPELTAKDQQAIRDRFAQANEEEKAAIAAEVRKTAKTELRETFEVNLERLEEMELQSGQKMPLIKRHSYELKEAYNRSGLARKTQIVSEIQEQKLNLVSEEQLNGLINLRKILELGSDTQPDPEDHDLTNQQRVQDEVERIIMLASKRIFSRGNRRTSEIEMEEVEDLIKGITTTYENPDLTKTYELALLLRLSRNDFFKF